MAVKTVYELYDFLTPNNAFAITANREGVETTLSSATDTVSYMLSRYATRKKAFIKGDSITRSEALQDFIEDFTRFKNFRQDGIDKMFDAMMQEYNPIENVFEDISETTTTDDDLSRSETTTHNTTDTTTYNSRNAKTGTDTVSHDGKDTDTHSVAGFNNQSSYSPDNKDEHSFDSSDETAYNSTDAKSGTDATAHTGTEAVAGTDNRDIETEHTYHRHGNIGVSSAQSLIVQSLDLYKRSLAEELIDLFINEYTFYA